MLLVYVPPIFVPETESMKWFAPPSFALLLVYVPLIVESVTISLKILCTAEIMLTVSVKSWLNQASQPKEVLLQFWAESEQSSRLDPDEVKKDKVIGRGGNAVVYGGFYHGKKVAIKEILNQDCMTTEDFDDFMKEVTMMEKLSHEAIVKFIGVLLVPMKLAIVSELCEYGSFQSAMSRFPEVFDDKLKIKCLVDAASAMEFLHGLDIIHRDLKPENLLVVSLDFHAPIVAKLSDFGTTRDVSNVKRKMALTNGIGTPLYMAPEILEGSKNYGKPVDVYSFSRRYNFL